MGAILSLREAHRIDAIDWRSPGLASFRATIADVQRSLGPPSIRGFDTNGVGPADAYLVRCDCGLEISVWTLLHDEMGRRIDPNCDPTWCEIYSSGSDVEHVAFHLGLDAALLSHSIDSSGVPIAVPRVRPFRIVRLDANGNEFTIRTTSSRCEADELVREFEARGHKQTYWIERSTNHESA